MWHLHTRARVYAPWTHVFISVHIVVVTLHNRCFSCDFVKIPLKMLKRQHRIISKLLILLNRHPYDVQCLIADIFYYVNYRYKKFRFKTNSAERPTAFRWCVIYTWIQQTLYKNYYFKSSIKSRNSDVLKLMKSKTFQTVWTTIVSTSLVHNERQSIEPDEKIKYL